MAMNFYNMMCFFDMKDKYNRFAKVARSKTGDMLSANNMDAVIGKAHSDISILHSGMHGVIDGMKIAPCILVDWENTEKPHCWMDEETGIHWMDKEGEEAYREKILWAVQNEKWITYNLLCDGEWNYIEINTTQE